MLSYLFANRFVHITETTPNYEIYTFFSAWGLSLLLAFLTKKQYLWKSQVFIFGLIALALPAYDFVYLINHRLISDLSSYWLFLRIDLFLFVCALFAVFIFRNIQPIQEKSAQKIKTKLAKNEVKA